MANRAWAKVPVPGDTDGALQATPWAIAGTDPVIRRAVLLGAMTVVGAVLAFSLAFLIYAIVEDRRGRWQW